MIEPTIGRVVWFWPGAHVHAARPGFQVHDAAVPCNAHIAFVHSDRKEIAGHGRFHLVNLTVSDHSGASWRFENVLLWQGEGERPSDRFCEWMPFQKGQASKTEELARQIENVKAVTA